MDVEKLICIVNVALDKLYENEKIIDGYDIG